MKKKWLKRLVCAGAAFVMTVALGACGSKQTADPALAKQNVYRIQEFSLPDVGSEYFNIAGSMYKDDIVYLLAEIWGPNSNGQPTVKLITMKNDGTDSKAVDLEMPKKEDSAASGDTAPGGTARPLPGITPRDTAVQEEDAEEDSAVEDGAAVDTAPRNVWEYTSYANYTMGADGKIYALKNYNFEDYTDPENYVSLQERYISSWNVDGSFVKEVKLEGLTSEDEWIGVRNILVAEDGTVNLLLSGNSVYKMSIDPQGNPSDRKEVSEELTEVFGNSNNILAKADGTLLVMYYEENDYSKQYAVSYNPDTDALSEPSLLPASFSAMGYSTLTSGASSDILFSTSSGIYGFNIGDTDVTMKMSYINSDLNASNFESIVELDENTIFGVYSENYRDTKAAIFTYVDPSEIPDKSVLVLAGNYVDSEMKQRIVEYNRSSEQFRIVVKEYNMYGTNDDWQAGYTQLNNDIITGGMPDILITDNLPVEKYISKGLLADIQKLIESDEELSGTEFMQNVFDAYSVDGKLYYVIPSFRIQTMIGKKSILGEQTSWTMKDMLDLAATMPEKTQMIGELTRDNFMEMAMRYCGNDFVDVSTGKCDFNSEGFIALMEFAKTLPTELSDDYFGEDYWANYQSQYRDGRTILYNLYISSANSINYVVNGYFGEPVTYIGFPTQSGQGSVVTAIDSYAISAKSANQEEAWNFVKYYLSDEYQSEISYGLPVNKKYFKEQAQKATKRPSYTDENGNLVEYDESFYLNGERIILPPFTQEQVDELVSVIESVNKSSYSNTNIINIINEEVAAFYTGQKSAQDTAQVIQSRVSIYVQENR